MKFYIVDAFTSKPFGGNPAGVVLLEHADFPCDKLMQQVAAELRYSETAFVRCEGNSTFTLRYFTPCGEVDLCGHATIASFGVLLHEGVVSEGEKCLLHTLASDLQVEAGKQVMMQMAPPTLQPTAVDTERLHRIMGGDIMQWPSLPIEVISTGLPDIMMPVANLEVLHTLQPDMEELEAMSRELDVVGVHAFALSDDGFTAHTRNFAPRYGIPEESATGTASGALTHYLQRNGIIEAPCICRFMQGEVMNRPSVIITQLQANGSIMVGGNSRIIARGNLLP